MSENVKKSTVKKRTSSNCETCVYYDYDDFMESYTCKQNLDEDDMVRFITRNSNSCPFYRFYDEYKSVHRQI